MHRIVNDNTQLSSDCNVVKASNMKLVMALHSSDDIVSMRLRREAGCVISRLHFELFGSVKNKSVFLALLLFPT